ncbi:hypothetical protein M758_1G069300 [Ceratodon purpureus]|nr:hypothetical protein M758_1G069300 [Ceratodon purpureus]
MAEFIVSRGQFLKKHPVYKPTTTALTSTSSSTAMLKTHNPLLVIQAPELDRNESRVSAPGHCLSQHLVARASRSKNRTTKRAWRSRNPTTMSSLQIQSITPRPPSAAPHSPRLD